MIRTLFDKALRRVEAAGIRSFKPEHVELIYRDLQDIPDVTWGKMVDDLILLESPPKNIVGWFKRTLRDYLPKIAMNDEASGIQAGEYTKDQMILFDQCVNQATKVFRGLPDEYHDWAEWFSVEWMGKTGDALTAFLKDHIKGLKESEKFAEPRERKRPELCRKCKGQKLIFYKDQISKPVTCPDCSGSGRRTF